MTASDALYQVSAKKATLDGHRPGSHPWREAIRYYNAEAHQETVVPRNESGLNDLILKTLRDVTNVTHRFPVSAATL